MIDEISYKTFMGSKPLRISFGKTDGFSKIYYGIRYLVLREYERYDAIDDSIKYLTSEKAGIINSINHINQIRHDSNNYLPVEK